MVKSDASRFHAHTRSKARDDVDCGNTFDASHERERGAPVSSAEYRADLADASHGLIRPITRGEVLIEGGQTNVPFFVVKAGEIEVIRPSGLGALLIAIVRANQFTGDISIILGRPAQMRLSASQSGEVVQLTCDQIHALVQTDAEIIEVLMGALIHRRIAMVARGIGDALLIGSAQSAATLRIKAFLTRNDHPFKYLDLDRDADAGPA